MSRMHCIRDIIKSLRRESEIQIHIVIAGITGNFEGLISTAGTGGGPAAAGFIASVALMDGKGQQEQHAHNDMGKEHRQADDVDAEFQTCAAD